MITTHFQKILLDKIKEQVSNKHSLSDVITDLLQVSKDSAYRRMRGDTILSLDEAIILAGHFRISLNTVAGHTDDSALFTRQSFIRTLDDYRGYMQKSLDQLQHIQQQKNHTLYYLAKDIPIFYQYAFPELAAFKMYVWLKSVYGLEKLDDQNYNMQMIPEDLLELARKQWEVFSRINTIEIWNDTTILSLLNQIEYYYEAGLLSSREEALKLCDQFRDMMKIIYKQALQSQRVHAVHAEAFNSASYKMYFHEILIMDNHILAEFNDQCVYFIPYTGVNYLSTSDTALTHDVKEYLRKQIKKSALISDVSEKDRNRFFIKIKNSIDQLKNRILSTDPFI